MDHHRQCKLSKQNGNKMEVLITWIPEEFAKIGKALELKMSNGIWENGWSVYKVYGRRETTEVAERERDYLKNRLASDI